MDGRIGDLRLFLQNPIITVAIRSTVNSRDDSFSLRAAVCLSPLAAVDHLPDSELSKPTELAATVVATRVDASAGMAATTAASLPVRRGPPPSG